MEVTGLVLGVVGSFSACMDMLERLHSYRDFGISSGQLATRFEAAELRLQEWANGVGIMDDRLKNRIIPGLMILKCS